MGYNLPEKKGIIEPVKKYGIKKGVLNENKNKF